MKKQKFKRNTKSHFSSSTAGKDPKHALQRAMMPWEMAAKGRKDMKWCVEEIIICSLHATYFWFK